MIAVGPFERGDKARGGRGSTRLWAVASSREGRRKRQRPEFRVYAIREQLANLMPSPTLLPFVEYLVVAETP
jgi:hypothetical protein